MARDRRAWIGILATAWMCAAVGSLLVPRPLARAASPAPEPDSTPALTRLVPPGLSRGTTTEWVVTGRNLDAVDRFLITGTGVEVADWKPGSDGTLSLTVHAAASAEPGFRAFRVVGPEGISNLLLFRVDHLPQILEREPNDDPAHATAMDCGSVAAGVLQPQDLDHFRIAGRGGRTVTIEVEARRLGTPISPVVTVLSPSGAALAQGRPMRGLERDTRLSYTFPADADYILQVHDSLYGGSDSAVYRLRVDDAPFATGMFPLGGPPGATIAVTVSGGTLAEPRTKRIVLPEQPGEVVAAGAFDGIGGPVLAPARLVVGDGPEIVEGPADEEGQSTTRLPFGRTANGRIGRPGEVDRYVVPVQRGDHVRVRVQAEALGSWLDSLVTLRDDRGHRSVENDDAAPLVPYRLSDHPSSDSVLDFPAEADGELRIEITDRDGEGGPEYPYRLTVGPARADFMVLLLVGNPSGRRDPESEALNLRPGTSRRLDFRVLPAGHRGTIRIHARDLPPGVTSVPVFAPAAHSLVLEVADGAEPTLGTIQVEAMARVEEGVTLSRLAAAHLAVGVAPRTAQDHPVLRVVTSFPVAILPAPPESKKSMPR